MTTVDSASTDPMLRSMPPVITTSSWASPTRMSTEAPASSWLMFSGLTNAVDTNVVAMPSSSGQGDERAGLHLAADRERDAAAALAGRR